MVTADEMNGCKRLFVDMDGTLAEFKNLSTLETLYEPGYFANLEPMTNVVDAIRKVNAEGDVEVFVLSAVLMDSKYAREEKDAWLDSYLPEVDQEHRVFVPCGDDKSKYVPGGIQSSDVLLDDYSKNLISWNASARGLKLLNGINNTKGTWQGEKVSVDSSTDTLAAQIREFVFRMDIIQDESLNDEYEPMTVGSMVQEFPLPITISDAEMILDYMEGHDYRLLFNKERELFRQDISDDEIEPFSWDDVFYTVSEWNDSLLEYEKEREDPMEDKIKVLEENAERLTMIDSAMHVGEPHMMPPRGR